MGEGDGAALMELLGVVLGGLIAVAGGIAGAAYTARLERERSARAAEAAETEAIRSAALALMHAGVDLVGQGSIAGAKRASGEKQGMAELAGVTEALRQAGVALDRLRMVGPLAVQEAGAALYDTLLDYFVATTREGLEEIKAQTVRVQEAKIELLRVLDRPVLPPSLASLSGGTPAAPS